MEVDVDQMLENALRDGIREGVKAKFSSQYNNPLDGIIVKSLEKHGPALRDLLDDSISSCISDPTFRQNISDAVHKNLAKLLVQRFGGELEKQVNTLKSDPTTRARITIAIEDIVKSCSK